MAQKKTRSRKSKKTEPVDIDPKIKELCDLDKRKVPTLIVAEMMEKKGKSHGDIAKALGIVHPSNVARIKKSQTLTFPTLIKLAIALGCSVKDLIKE